MSAIQIIKPEFTVNEEPKKNPSRTLASYRVSHDDTIGMTWEQIDNLRPPFVVDGFGRRGELMICAAESKSRKSWLVQDIGFSVAMGEPWLAKEDGTGGFETAQAKVHVFDLELSDGEMRFRFAKARGNRTASISEQEAITERFAHYALEDVLSLDVVALLDELRETVDPGDLVIVDCLYRLHPDGNETAQIADVMTTLKNFAKETQSMVVIVDHFRKAGADKARDRIAGSFVKSAAPSTIVAIQVNAEKVLELSIDARTFQGVDKVHARFNVDNYRFESVGDDYAAPATVDSFTQHLLDLWQSHDHGATVTKKQAQVKWNLPNLGSADYRLSKMEGMKWLFKRKEGKAWSYSLTGRGLEILQSAKPLAHSLALAEGERAEMLME